MSRGRAKRGARRSREPLLAGDLVNSLLEKHRVCGGLRESRAVQAWPELVGERVAARSWPAAIKNRVLLVVVADSSWQYQLAYLKTEIVAKVNALAGPDLITDVRFELSGRAKFREGLHAKQIDKRVTRKRLRPPSPACGAELSAIERESDAVDDDELRDIIASTRKRWNL